MNATVESAIRRAYPTGIVHNLDEAVIENVDRDKRVRSALEHSAAECRLYWDVFQWVGKPAYEIWFTQEEHMPLRQWTQMKVPEQLAWLKRNGEPYPVLWLNISRVADYFYRYYNHWTPRGETGYVDADCTRLPNSTWLGYQSVIEEQLQKHGFELMSKETASEETPFILERDYDSIPDDDPRWADDDFEPPWMPSTVHECLFSY